MRKWIFLTSAALVVGACQGRPSEDSQAEQDFGDTSVEVLDNAMGNDALGDSAGNAADNAAAPEEAAQSPAQTAEAPAAPAKAPVKAAAAASGDVANGKRIFTQTCVACHGANGKGAIPGVPDLATRLSKSDSILLRNMTNGFQSPGSPMPMPPKGGNPSLTDKDMADVLAYLRAQFQR